MANKMAKPKAEDKKQEKKAPVKNLKKIATKKRIDLVRYYTDVIKKEFGPNIISVVVFGSFARGDYQPFSDIDVMVVLDDSEQMPMPQALRTKVDAKLHEIARRIDPMLHCHTYVTSEFWDKFISKEYTFIHFLREGTAIHDVGFFRPVKRLLLSGNVLPSREAVLKQLDLSKKVFTDINKQMRASAELLFRAVSWSANGTIMALDKPPARPKEIGNAMHKLLVQPKLIEKKYIETYLEIFLTHKHLEHNEKDSISPKKLSELQAKTIEFCEKMDDLSTQLLEKKENSQKLRKKLRETPKIFWLYKNLEQRGYAWVFEESVYIAIYEGPSLRDVFTATFDKNSVIGELAKAPPDQLFRTIQESSFEPVFDEDTVKKVVAALDETLRHSITKIGVEFPKNALVDLSSSVLGTA